MNNEREGITLPWVLVIWFTRSLSSSSRNFSASRSLPTWMNCIPTCDRRKGSAALSDEDARWIKYLVSRIIPLLEEPGMVDNTLFWAVGWFTERKRKAAVLNARMRDVGDGVTY